VLVGALVYIVGSLYTRAVAGSNPAAPTSLTVRLQPGSPSVTVRRQRAALVDVVVRPRYPLFVSAARDELRELVEQLSDDEVPAVLAEVRRHVVPVTTRPWPPAFFGAGEASRSDVAERAEEILGEGFGRPA